MQEFKKVRKKPVEVEAFQLTQEVLDNLSIDDLPEGNRQFGIDECTLSILTLEGSMLANVNDWIIKGVNGECYPCKPDIFEKTYDILEEGK